MQYRRMGKTGLRLSALSFGSWVTFSNQVDEDLATNLMKTAYDAGVNFFDNAEVYASGESERIMGKALKRLGWSRDSWCVSSKVFWGGELPTQRGLNRKHIFDACHAALKRLQVDYLDIFFCHRPDFHTPVEETVRAMNDLISQGKVMYWGTSEWNGRQLMEAYGAARSLNLVPPSVEQPQYNLLTRDKLEADFLDVFERTGMGTTTWSPLASGLLTGKYNDGIPEGSRMELKGYEWLRKMVESDEGRRKLEKAKALGELAKDLGISQARMSIAWCLKNPNVSTVILGASRVEQLEENLEAINDLPLFTDEVMERIEEIASNKPRLPIDYL